MQNKKIMLLKDILYKKTPEILIGVGISGMVITTGLTVFATAKAVKKCDLKLKELQKTNPKILKLGSKDIVKVSWKYYISPATTLAVSIGCIIGGNSIHIKRSAAAAAAYVLSERALSEYKEKVLETLGEEKESEIRSKIYQDRLENNPVKSDIVLSKGENTLCYDSIGGRYFRSNIEKIRHSVNELNSRMLVENYVSLNDLYYELGLESTLLGDDLGWNVDDGLIDMQYGSRLNEDGEPCVVMDYTVAPRYDYGKLL